LIIDGQFGTINKCVNCQLYGYLHYLKSLQKSLYSQLAKLTALKETDKTLSTNKAELHQRLVKQAKVIQEASRFKVSLSEEQKIRLLEQQIVSDATRNASQARMVKERDAEITGLRKKLTETQSAHEKLNQDFTGVSLGV
jgi:hypothetical protein